MAEKSSRTVAEKIAKSPKTRQKRLLEWRFWQPISFSSGAVLSVEAATPEGRRASKVELVAFKGPAYDPNDYAVESAPLGF